MARGVPPVDAVRSGPRLPVVVALHGLGGDENGVLGLDLPGYLADVVGDPFVDAARDFAAGLSPAPAGSFGIGGHDGRYWRRVAPAQLSFLGRALVTT